MDQPVSRRAWITGLVSTAGAFAAACGPGQGVTEVNTPDGRVLQFQGDELLFLVSGLQPRYRAGETVKVNVLVNNQSTRPLQFRVRARILGRADQAVREAGVATLGVRPDEAGSVDHQITLPRSMVPDEYTLSIEIPPPLASGREVGRQTIIRGTFQVDPPT
jgi:hypothetical protein